MASHQLIDVKKNKKYQRIFSIVLTILFEATILEKFRCAYCTTWLNHFLALFFCPLPQAVASRKLIDSLVKY